MAINHNHRFIGIDNGLDGAIVILDYRGRFISCTDVPTINVKSGKKNKRKYLVSNMAQLIPDVMALNIFVSLEKAQAMKGQGVSSTFSTGYGAGLWEGIVAALGIPYTVSHPKTWQNSMIRDVPGTDTKARSVLAASRLFPGLDLSRKKDHNRADAALIAEYGRRIYQSNNGE